MALRFGAAAVGCAIAIALVAFYGTADIGKAIIGAGWGILLLIAYHLTQLWFTALAWRTVLPARSAPRLAIVMGLRWIREAINSLLPVAQIGGELVSIRLLGLAGVPLGTGAASVTVDLTLEFLTQIVLTLIGLALLIPDGNAPLAPWILGGAAAATGILLALVSVQRFGLFRLIEQGLIWLSAKMGWSTLGEITGLDREIVALYKAPGRLCVAGSFHLISWLLGGLEVMIALRFVDVSVDLREGLIIESLAQALRAVGFAVPGSLGVQEAGYVVACGLVGVSPQAAIELSFLKRIRDVAYGVPGLVTWYAIEARRFANRIGVSQSDKRQSESAL